MRFIWKNFDEFKKKFDAKLMAHEPFKRAFTKTAIMVQTEARQLASRFSDTGAAVRNIGFEVDDNWPILKARVGGNLHYLPALEAGSGILADGSLPGGKRQAYFPPPAALEGWARRHQHLFPFPVDGFAVAKMIRKKGGTPPKKFLRTALANKTPDFENLLNGAMVEMQHDWEAI